MMADTLRNHTDQAEVVNFLAKCAGNGETAERIDTHGAMVFLIGDRALKIKRAVKYDYMDLSTLDKRHALLDREFALNHEIAPSVYREVLPVVRGEDGKLHLGGTGEVQEWVLSMNRFPAEAELYNIARTEGISDDLARDLGLSIARYHATRPQSALDGATLIGEIIDELERVFATLQPIFGNDAAAFNDRCRAMADRHAETLHARSRHGHVRRCHGDLHLGNIVMIEGQPTPFDALEFDERLGTCDTLYDLAFLLMDLDHMGMRHAANLVLNAYLPEAHGDLSDAGLALLPLYLSIRAAVRAMVEAQTAGFSDRTADKQRKARAYLARAIAYLDPAPPLLVAIGGLSGTGKTTVARAFAHHVGAAPGAIHIRSDVQRKALMHRKPLQPLGPEGYTAQITARTYDTIRQQAAQVLGQGHGAIIDAVHSDPAARAAVGETAASAGCAFAGFWLEAPLDTLLARVTDRADDASDADATVVTRQASTDPGPIDWHRINANRPVAQIVDEMKEILNSKEQERTNGREC